MYDRIDCLMAVADKEGYGGQYGRLVAETTRAQRDVMEVEGRAILTRRDTVRKAARGRNKPEKGEGKWKSDPERRRT